MITPSGRVGLNGGDASLGKLEPIIMRLGCMLCSIFDKRYEIVVHIQLPKLYVSDAFEKLKDMNAFDKVEPGLTNDMCLYELGITLKEREHEHPLSRSKLSVSSKTNILVFSHYPINYTVDKLKELQRHIEKKGAV